MSVSGPSVDPLINKSRLILLTLADTSLYKGVLEFFWFGFLPFVAKELVDTVWEKHLAKMNPNPS